jgi:hypothetical protein
MIIRWHARCLTACPPLWHTNLNCVVPHNGLYAVLALPMLASEFDFEAVHQLVHRIACQEQGCGSYAKAATSTEVPQSHIVTCHSCQQGLSSNAGMTHVAVHSSSARHHDDQAMKNHPSGLVATVSKPCATQCVLIGNTHTGYYL